MEAPCDGSFLEEAQLMQETFPPSTIFPGGARRLLVSSLDSSTAGKQIHCWNSNPLRFQLLSLSQTPTEQLSHGPAGSPAARYEPFTKTSASPKWVQDLVKKKESRNHPRESKLALPAESEAQGAGLQQQGWRALRRSSCGKQHIPLSLPLFLF